MTQPDLFTTSPVNEPEQVTTYHYVIDGRIVKSYEMTDSRAVELNAECERGHQIMGRYVRADKFTQPKPKTFSVKRETRTEW